MGGRVALEDVDVHVVVWLANAVVGWAAASVNVGGLVGMNCLFGWSTKTCEAEGSRWTIGVVVGW